MYPIIKKLIINIFYKLFNFGLKYNKYYVSMSSINLKMTRPVKIKTPKAFKTTANTIIGTIIKNRLTETARSNPLYRFLHKRFGI